MTPETIPSDRFTRSAAHRGGGERAAPDDARPLERLARASAAERTVAILDEAPAALGAMETHADGRQSAVFSLLGHKGDLMFVHFRRSFEELNQAERDVSRLRSERLSGAGAFVSFGGRVGALRIDR